MWASCYIRPLWVPSEEFVVLDKQFYWWWSRGIMAWRFQDLVIVVLDWILFLIDPSSSIYECSNLKIWVKIGPLWVRSKKFCEWGCTILLVDLCGQIPDRCRENVNVFFAKLFLVSGLHSRDAFRMNRPGTHFHSISSSFTMASSSWLFSMRVN
jgi:hypothetical protein